MDAKTVFNVGIVNPADRLYNLKAAVRDSADNRASLSTKIGLDKTAPQNSLASAPTISATEAFKVSWSAGTDGTGSGIAAYDLYYKSGDAVWQLWFSTAEPGDSTFTGVDGVEYRFESIARDYIGLAEPFSSNGEVKVLVDLSANDKEAPPPPINLLANDASPSAWTNKSQFTKRRQLRCFKLNKRR